MSDPVRQEGLLTDVRVLDFTRVLAGEHTDDVLTTWLGLQATELHPCVPMV